MEFINVYFGGRIQSIATVKNGLEHDETRHAIKVSDASLQKTLGANTFEVNSYHRMLITADQLASGLTAFAMAPDNTVEGYSHTDYALAAIIWHPEREAAPHELNNLLVHSFLNRKLFWQQRKEFNNE